MLESRDILCLRRRRLKSMRKAKKVWRHNPLHGIGHRDEHGKQIYNTPEMDGLMELYVFARFQYVLFIADFKFTAEESYMYIDDDLNVDTDDQANLLVFCVYRV